jgi:hypothetical protein
MEMDVNAHAFVHQFGCLAAVHPARACLDHHVVLACQVEGVHKAVVKVMEAMEAYLADHISQCEKQKNNYCFSTISSAKHFFLYFIF